MTEEVTVRFLIPCPGRHTYYKKGNDYTIKKVIADKYINTGYAVRVK